MVTFITILTGVSVFVIGQFILKLVLEPIVDLKKQIGTVSALFLLHQSDIRHRKGDRKLVNEIRKISAELISARRSVPLYKYISKILCLPSEKDINEAAIFLKKISELVLKIELKKGMPSIKKPNDIMNENNSIVREIENSLKIKLTYKLDE
ncbi:hypothetical protein [Xenorhabdus bovienii]|uniref:hypothetical protein n=1 Tax=Xenorhabdus bovienii TaxID=40576 RepID=UPI00237C737C|nr:hypothetical protein [Xenorhabdus bovienii]MDE1492794.1 hypothetical protein [Xenorhabdus bovienii]